ncbi:MAG: prolyl oligopeptidase family serine peptidase [Bryobacteraceae bacterium]
MKISIRITTTVLFAALAALLTLHLPNSAQAQPPAAAKGKGGGFAQDPRAQTRTYHFADTNEEMPYSVYVSSKIKTDQKAPLILTLHGLGAPQTIMMGAAAIDLAEEGGYILVAPMGYNTGGWYGSPAFAPGAGRGPGKGAPDAAKGPPPAGKGPGGDAAKGKAGPPPPENLRELSEKDTMNVLAMVRKEFKIDDNRIYVMGHSMGGAGALYLGGKYPKIFAAVGAEAPAAFWQTRKETLQPMKDAKVPVMIVHGDIDEVVNVSNSHAWVEVMKELKMDYEFVEQPGITHGPVIQSGLKPIYAFFAKHKK